MWGGNLRSAAKTLLSKGPTQLKKDDLVSPTGGVFFLQHVGPSMCQLTWLRMQQVWPQLGADRPVRLTLTDFAHFGPRGPGHELATELEQARTVISDAREETM